MISPHDGQDKPSSVPVEIMANPVPTNGQQSPGLILPVLIPNHSQDSSRPAEALVGTVRGKSNIRPDHRMGRQAHSHTRTWATQLWLVQVMASRAH